MADDLKTDEVAPPAPEVSNETPAPETAPPAPEAKLEDQPTGDAPADAPADPLPEYRDERAAAFAVKAKQNVRDALAAQPHRGYPSFEDLLAVADAIVDTLAKS